MMASKSEGQHLFSFTTPIYVPNASKTAGGAPLVSTDGTDGGVPQAPFEGDNLGGGQLRAVEDAVPCYRGNPYLPDGLEYLTGWVNARILGPNSTARVKAPLVSAVQMRSGQLIDERSGLPVSRRMASVKVTERLRELWNITRRRGMREPWRAPITRPEDDDDDLPQAHNDPFTLRVDIKAALKEFIEQPVRPAKMLVFDHIPYGWDLNALQEATMKIVNEHVGQPGWFSSAQPIASVRVTYERVRPWLDISVRKTRLRSLPIDAGIERIPVPTSLFILGSVSIIGIILSFILSDIGSDGFSIWSVRLLTFASIAGLFYTGLQVTLLSRVLCTDTILMAHPLKRWRPTGLPASYSREEVLTALTKRRLALSGGLNSDTIHLSRRTDGWYVLQGMREGDWLRDHHAVLVAAIKERKTCDLTGEVLSDAPEVQRQKRRDAREEDDSVGL